VLDAGMVTSPTTGCPWVKYSPAGAVVCRDYLDHPSYAHSRLRSGGPLLRGGEHKGSLFLANPTFRPAIDALC
jgi:hypothetical protein